MAVRKAKAATTRKAKPAAHAPAKRAAKRQASAPKRATAPAAKKAVAAKPAVKPAVAAAAAVAQPVIEAANHIANEGNKTMNKAANRTIEGTMEAGQAVADRTQAAFGDINARAKNAMERSTKMVEEMTELTKGNVEAIVVSSKAAARGVETLGQDVAEFGRKRFEEASTTVKSFTQAKSPTDFFRLQSEFAKSQFDAMVAESSRMSETMLKLAGEMFEPLSSRYSVAADRVKNIAS